MYDCSEYMGKWSVIPGLTRIEEDRWNMQKRQFMSLPGIVGQQPQTQPVEKAANKQPKPSKVAVPFSLADMPTQPNGNKADKKLQQVDRQQATPGPAHPSEGLGQQVYGYGPPPQSFSGIPSLPGVVGTEMN